MTTDDGSRPRPPTETVLLVRQDRRDRELLAEWLDGLGGYEVVTATDPADAPAEYDICLLDRGSLDAFAALLAERKRESGSVYLPHVLTVTESAAADATPAARGQLEAAADGVVDDILTLPVAKATLKRRLENLLQTRRASLRLAEREQQYRRLVELTPETILLVDDGEVVYANEAAATLLGTPDTTTIVGRSLSSFVAPEDRPTVEQLLGQIHTEESTAPEFVECELRWTGDRPVEAALTGVPVSYEGRTVTQLVVRDLTERREREERLALFGRAIEAAAQGITIADARQEDEPLIYANEGFRRITGYDTDEVIGRNCRFLQGEGTDEATVATLRGAIDDERPVSVDLLNYRKDGTPFWNRLDIVPVENDAGEVTHFLGLQRDVTEEKEREQQLSVLNRVLRHNLRNKMNVARIHAERLLSDPENVEESATAIREAADELLQVSEQVREFDAVLAGDEQTLQPVDLADVLAGALRETEAATFAATTPESARIEAHPTLVTAIEDLLALPEADEEGFEVALERTEQEVLVRVTDPGGTLAPEDLDIVSGGAETPMEHLQDVELWLIRWAVERSRGEFDADTDGECPTIRLRFATPTD